jgi:hypothetical protein
LTISSTFSKLLERAVHFQLYAFLTRNKILNPYQCGFREGYSAESAVIAFTDTIRRQMEQGNFTAAVFLDLRKAFDTVAHTVLLNKL